MWSATFIPCDWIAPLSIICGFVWLLLPAGYTWFLKLDISSVPRNSKRWQTGFFFFRQISDIQSEDWVRWNKHDIVQENCLPQMSKTFQTLPKCDQKINYSNEYHHSSLLWILYIKYNLIVLSFFRISQFTQFLTQNDFPDPFSKMKSKCVKRIRFRRWNLC